MGKLKKIKKDKPTIGKVTKDEKIKKSKLKRKGGKIEKKVAEEVRSLLKNGMKSSTLAATENITPVPKEKIKGGKKNIPIIPSPPKKKAKKNKKFPSKTEEQPKRIKKDDGSDKAAVGDEATSAPKTKADKQTNKKALKKKAKIDKAVAKSDGQDEMNDSKSNFDPEDAQKTIFVGNLPTNTKKLQLIKLFAKVGKVIKIRFRSADGKMIYANKTKKKLPSLNAYVVFAEVGSVPKAVEMSGVEFKEQHLRITTTGNMSDANDSKRTVFIGNLKYSCTEEQLHGIFSSCGEIEYVRTIQSDKGCKGVAYICFKKPESVGLALELNNTLVDDRPIRVEHYSKNKLGAHAKRKGEEELTGPAKRIADKQKRLEKSGKKGNVKNKKGDKNTKKSEFRGVQVDSKKKFKKKKNPNAMKQLAKRIAPRT